MTPHRRDVLRWLAGAAAIGVTACLPDDPARPEEPDPLDRLPTAGRSPDVIRVGVTPTSGSRTAKFFDPIVEHMERAHQLRAVVVSATSYDNLAELVHRGEIDAGFFSPLAYVRARQTLPAAPVATAARAGSPTYVGYLVTRGDDAAERLDDLRGKRIAYVDRGSTSGYLYPRALVRSRGHDPDRFFGPATFAGDHAAVIAAVVRGDVDVGATASPFVDPERFDRSADADRVKVVAKTSRIPLDCAVVHKSLSRELGRRWRDGLLDLARSPQAVEALSRSWGVSGFVPSDEHRYDEIATLLQSEPSL